MDKPILKIWKGKGNPYVFTLIRYIDLVAKGDNPHVFTLIKYIDLVAFLNNVVDYFVVCNVLSHLCSPSSC